MIDQNVEPAIADLEASLRLAIQNLPLLPEEHIYLFRGEPVLLPRPSSDTPLNSYKAKLEARIKLSEERRWWGSSLEDTMFYVAEVSAGDSVGRRVKISALAVSLADVAEHHVANPKNQALLRYSANPEREWFLPANKTSQSTTLVEMPASTVSKLHSELKTLGAKLDDELLQPILINGASVAAFNNRNIIDTTMQTGTAAVNSQPRVEAVKGV